MSSTCFEPEGSPSGRRMYVHLLYGMFYVHRYKRFCRQLILMHIKLKIIDVKIAAMVYFRF